MKKRLNYTSNLSPSRHANGFTIVELLVVVAILGIIGAIAIPIYSNYIASAKRESANASLEQFPILLESYRAENGSFPPDNTYSYIENNAGGVTTDTISPILPDFKPKKISSTATSFHYSLQISNSTKPNETAVIKVIGVNNVQGKNAGINATANYQ